LKNTDRPCERFQTRIFDEINEMESLGRKAALEKLNVLGKDCGLDVYKLRDAGMTVPEILKLCRARLEAGTGNQAAGS
jgi:hypothetical protein